MAFCPKCEGTMDTMEPVCPHCGYDFPRDRDVRSLRRSGFAYSSAANIALLAGAVAAGLGCALAAIGMIVSLFHRNFQELVAALFIFVLLAGLLVVFLRMSDC